MMFTAEQLKYAIEEAYQRGKKDTFKVIKDVLAEIEQKYINTNLFYRTTPNANPSTPNT